MKVVQINVTNTGSTGAIAGSISQKVREEGGTAVGFFGRISGSKNDGSIYRVGGKLSLYSHIVLARLGLNGHGSFFATLALRKKLLEMKPDVIVLHNIHGYYVNLKLLWKTLAELTDTKVYWFLHDSWCYTGGCAYYSAENCEKWKIPETRGGKERHCGKCPYLTSDYPIAYVDTTRREFEFKRKLFTSLPEERLTLISPSDWLAGEVKRSFMGKYKCIVKHTEIDKTVFYRRSAEEQKAALEAFGIPRSADDEASCYGFSAVPAVSLKKIVLSVAMVWDRRKQPDMVLKVARLLPDHIFLIVGLKPAQIKSLRRLDVPANVIMRGRTSSREELAALYSAADVLLNASLEDNYPLVPLEAQCCGTSVVSSNMCGNPETVTNGIVVNDPRRAEDYAEAIEKLTGAN